MENKDFEKIKSRIFYSSLLNIPTFGIPAVLAVILGRIIDKKLETEYIGTIVCLLISFILSWLLVLRMNSKITKEYREMRAKTKQQEQEPYHDGDLQL